MSLHDAVIKVAGLLSNVLRGLMDYYGKFLKLSSLQIFVSSAVFLDDMPSAIKFSEVVLAFSQLVLVSSISFDIILEKR